MKVKFQGFEGEDLVVRIVRDKKKGHHHIEMWHNGKMLWYAHLWKDAISLWDGWFNDLAHPGKPRPNIYIELGGEK